MVESVCNRLGAQLCFVYRHFPLSHLHPRTEPAAEAAEAAGAEGAFWPMHDSLFDHQEALEDTDLLARAHAIGLDVNQFATALASGLFAPRVHDDFLSGVSSGVNATPAFFINGVRYDGGRDADSLAAALEHAARPITRGAAR